MFLSGRVSKGKIILGAAAVVAAVFLFLAADRLNLRSDDSQAAAGQVTVSFLDVGQGDAILITTPSGGHLLIDGGPDEALLAALNKELSWFDRRFAWVFLTHPHADHVGGLNYLFAAYQIERIAASGVTHNSPLYLSWLDELQTRRIPLTVIDRRQTFDVGDGVKLEVLYPDRSLAGQKVDNLNNASLVLKLTYGQISWLLMGDMEEAGEKNLLAQNLFWRADVLKVGHHGSSDATGEEFLNAVNPRLAVISVGRDNSFGHPSPRLLKRLLKRGVEVWRTDLNGTVSMTSDGVNLTISP